MSDTRTVTREALAAAMDAYYEWEGHAEAAAAIFAALPAEPASAAPEKQLWRRHGRYGKFDHEPDTADVAYECEELGEGCNLHKPGQFAASPALDAGLRNLAEQAMQLAEHQPSLLRDDPAYRLANDLLMGSPATARRRDGDATPERPNPGQPQGTREGASALGEGTSALVQPEGRSPLIAYDRHSPDPVVQPAVSPVEELRRLCEEYGFSLSVGGGGAT
jgi:hypothetical protein